METVEFTDEIPYSPPVYINFLTKNGFAIVPQSRRSINTIGYSADGKWLGYVNKTEMIIRNGQTGELLSIFSSTISQGIISFPPYLTTEQQEIFVSANLSKVFFLLQKNFPGKLKRKMCRE